MQIQNKYPQQHRPAGFSSAIVFKIKNLASEIELLLMLAELQLMFELESNCPKWCLTRINYALCKLYFNASDYTLMPLSWNELVWIINGINIPRSTLIQMKSYFEKFTLCACLRKIEDEIYIKIMYLIRHMDIQHYCLFDSYFVAICPIPLVSSCHFEQCYVIRHLHVSLILDDIFPQSKMITHL